MLEPDPRPRRKQEEQGEQQDNDQTAVNISHSVPDIRVGGNHQPSQKIKKIVLQGIVRFKRVTRSRAVLKYKISRYGQSCGSTGGYDARCRKTDGSANKSLEAEPSGIALGLFPREQADIISRSEEHQEKA